MVKLNKIIFSLLVLSIGATEVKGQNYDSLQQVISNGTSTQSTFNYLASLYQKLILAFQKGDIELARDLQFQSVRFVEILIRHGGGVIGGKPVMKMIGLDCGPLRAPARNLSAAELKQYEQELNEIGFFEWCENGEVIKR